MLRICCMGSEASLGYDNPPIGLRRLAQILHKQLGPPTTTAAETRCGTY
jgi:hypothetical protein